MSHQKGFSRNEILYSIVDCVATCEGVSITELPPLHETIDIGALQHLLNSTEGDTIKVQFTYCDYHVTVTGDGGVTVDVGE